MINKEIDKGKEFDWGRASADYARFRDIYPEEFYRMITARGLCTEGQRVLDLGTGTGVLPRNMYRFGAKWTGTDISEQQIEQAKRLSEGMNIEYHAIPAEDIGKLTGPFDVVTACQCFFYFRHEQLIPDLRRLLTKDGRLVVLYMAWLPLEDRIAGESERLVLKYNPDWSGHSETQRPIYIPECYDQHFELVHSEVYRLNVRFSRESWHGRIKACRGIGASLSPEEIEKWEKEHIALLNDIAPETFDILHYAAMTELKIK